MFFDESIEQVFKNINSDKNGLSSQDAKTRLDKYGPNILEEKKKKSPIVIFFSQFKSFIVGILVAAVIISLFAEEYIDASVIGAILIFNAVFGFIQEYKAEKSIEALKKLTALKAKVIRDGKEQLIDAKELVPGDVISLETGDKVSADCRLFENINLETQEAPLTGESTPVRKELEILQANTALADRTNMIFSGTIVTKGHGKAVVTGTGMSTEIGKIAKMLAEVKEEQSPLQKKLQSLGKWLGIITIFVAAIVFFSEWLLHDTPVLETFLAAVALAVAAIPEGLPAVVTISLALGIQRMIKKNALIRTLPSVETLGATTVICSDKTGTLTKNEMTVKKAYLNHESINVSGSGYRPEGNFSKEPDELDLVLRIGALCNDAKLTDEFEIIGDPTEGCLIVSAAKKNIIKKDLDEKYPRFDEQAFDNDRKRMTTIHKIDNKLMAYSKGAPDSLLKVSTQIIENGRIRRLTDDDKNKILKEMEFYAGNALRVLGFAYREVKDKEKDYEHDLIFVGLQAMIDPPRDAVKLAVEKCLTAGIKPVIITGDHKLTAAAIADMIGIKGKAISGDELDKITNLEEVVESISIYARVNPEHKMRIIDALQKKGHVVAMTGDGVNDAPALKSADLGIAVGTGTDVAKESSDMILTNDNFANIVDAVEEGRGIYDNIKKFISFLLSANLSEVILIFFASLFGLSLPLVAVQILLINLVTDGMPALALGVDPYDKKIMQRKPRNPKAHIIDKNLAWTIFIIGGLIGFTCLGLFNYFSSDLPKARTIAFTALVLIELAIIFVIRGKYHVKVFSNKWLGIALLSSVLLQLAVVYVPFLNTLFKTVPLNLIEWAFIASAVVVVFVLSLIASKIISKATQEFD